MDQSLYQRLKIIMSHYESGRRDVAEQMCHEVLITLKDQPQVLSILGVICGQSGRFDEAVEFTGRAANALSTEAAAWNNYAMALRSAGKPAESLAAIERAISFNPNYIPAWVNKCSVHTDLRQLDQAAVAVNRALQLNPNDADAHITRAMLLLLQGDLINGFAGWEHRWNARGFHETNRTFTTPRWDGSPIAGRTIFVYAEKGFGDSIHFVRYVPLLVEQGAKVILEVPAELTDLMQTLPGAVHVISRGMTTPPFDTHVPMMSLPYCFRTTLQTIPNNVPYLFADAKLVSQWKARIAHLVTVSSQRTLQANRENNQKQMNLGLVWSGNPMQVRNRLRSLRPSLLQPLFDLPNINWFSLQKSQDTVSTAEARELPMINLASELSDFSQTAAALKSLDGLVTIDTSVAHLAGALGVRSWVFLDYGADYRYLLNRSDCPWYPTMHLFRETELGNRSNTIQQIAASILKISQH